MKAPNPLTSKNHSQLVEIELEIDCDVLDWLNLLGTDLDKAVNEILREAMLKSIENSKN